MPFFCDTARSMIPFPARRNACEFLNRRLTVEDAADAHVVALDRTPALGFEIFVSSAPTPFVPSESVGETRSCPRHRTSFSRRARTVRTIWLAAADKYRAGARCRPYPAHAGFSMRNGLRLRAGSASARTTGCPSPTNLLSDRGKKLPRRHRPIETTIGSKLCCPQWRSHKGSARGRRWALADPFSSRAGCSVQSSGKSSRVSCIAVSCRDSVMMPM